MIPWINTIIPDPTSYREIMDINETNKRIKNVQEKLRRFIIYTPKHITSDRTLNLIEVIDKVVDEEFMDLNREYTEAIKLGLIVSLERETNNNSLRDYINTECKRIYSYYNKYKNGDVNSGRKIEIPLLFYNFFGSNEAIEKDKITSIKRKVNINATIAKIIDEYAPELKLNLFSGGRAARTDMLKSSILKIIMDGKLSNYGLSKEVLNREMATLSKHESVGKSFLVIGQGLNEEVKDYIRSQPGLGGSAPYSRNIPYIESQNKFSTFLFKSKYGLQSTKDLEKKLIELQAKKPYLFAIYPLDEKNAEIQVNNPDNNQRLSSSKRILDYIKLGDFDESGFWKVILEHEVPMPELLSLLPLSAFARNLKDPEILFLDEKTEELRKEFKIKSVFDWRDVKPKDLASKLLTYQKPKYSDEDEPKDFKERIKTISRNIIGSINEFDRYFH